MYCVTIYKNTKNYRFDNVGEICGSRASLYDKETDGGLLGLNPFFMFGLTFYAGQCYPFNNITLSDHINDQYREQSD